MKNEEYNGYTNYETWLMSLHIDNDQYTKQKTQEIANEIMKNDEVEQQDKKYEIADQIKEEMEGLIWTELDQSETHALIKDLTNAAWQNVDWKDIAENKIQTYEEEK